MYTLFITWKLFFSSLNFGRPFAVSVCAHSKLSLKSRGASAPQPLLAYTPAKVGRSLNDRTVNFMFFHCRHPKLHIIPTVLASSELLTNLTVQIAFLYISRVMIVLYLCISESGAPCLCELYNIDLHKSRNQQCTSHKKFSGGKQVHVGMETSKTNQTRWEWHHNTFTPSKTCIVNILMNHRFSVSLGSSQCKTTGTGTNIRCEAAGSYWCCPSTDCILYTVSWIFTIQINTTSIDMCSLLSRSTHLDHLRFLQA